MNTQSPLAHTCSVQISVSTVFLKICLWLFINVRCHFSRKKEESFFKIWRTGVGEDSVASCVWVTFFYSSINSENCLKNRFFLLTVEMIYHLFQVLYWYKKGFFFSPKVLHKPFGTSSYYVWAYKPRIYLGIKRKTMVAWVWVKYSWMVNGPVLSPLFTRSCCCSLRELTPPTRQGYSVSGNLKLSISLKDTLTSKRYQVLQLSRCG